MRNVKANVLRLAYLLLFCCLLKNSEAQNPQSPLVWQAGVIINANCHGYLEYVPPGYNPQGTQKYPLLLFFNGHGSQGDGSMTDLAKFFTGAGTPPEQCDNGWWVPSYTVGGQTFSFIVITPQFIRPFCCSAMPSTGEVDDIINYMIQHYKVDESRIYMTGVSSGAYIPFEYTAAGGQYANRIAAIAPFATTSWGSQDKADTVAKYSVPVWAFHNLNDVNVFSINTTNWVNSINSPTAPIAPPTPLAKMTIFHHDSTNNINDSSHVCWWDTYLRNYTENGLNLYEWMLQYSRPVAPSNAPLPVKFSLVNAKCNKGSVDIIWKTASEENTADFVLEKSADGRNWNMIATLKATGKSSSEKSYSYSDKSSGANLYRIIANDMDGKKTYSNIVKADCDETTGISIYPNPVVDQAIIGLHLQTATFVEINIIDSKGSVVLREKKLVPSGNNQLSFDLNKFPRGTYTLSACWNGETRNERFIKM